VKITAQALRYEKLEHTDMTDMIETETKTETETEMETEKTTEAEEREYVVFTRQNVRTEDMRKKSDISIEQLAEYLERFPGLSGIEKTLVEAQDEYAVNAILLLAIIRLESGNGRSSAAQTMNNLGGLIVFERSVRVFKSFDSRYDCIIYMARLLSGAYLTEGGRFFSGHTLPDISRRYSTASQEWTAKVAQIITEIQAGLDQIETAAT
jgi:beta-N-acetylglucosaminidase